MTAENGIDVVVPIHDAYEDLVACLASVAAHTDLPHRLILIDDGSRDPRVPELLDGLRGSSPNLLLSRHPEALGFVRSANEGFAASRESDVVLLNSDTVVTAGWLQKLRRTARSRPDVATVTPLTNNGTLCTIPDPARPGALPAGWTVEALGELVESRSLHLRPETPTGVGFCLYVTRAALSALGGFDVREFGDGYGEENDFCRRAVARGLVNLIADDTFVYHRGGASFGDSKDARVEANLRVLNARHPGYADVVERYEADHPLAPFHRLLARALEERGPAVRVLHVLHGGGGTERHARDLSAEAGDGFVSFVARSDGAAFDVDEYRGGARVARLRLPFAAPLPREFLFSHGAYREAFDALCALTGTGLVHVHHLLGGTLDIAAVARDRGLPYCVTLHDYFALCPRYTLLDPGGAVCDGCTSDPGGARAAACMRDLGAEPADLAEHQRRLRGFLDGAAAVFVPSAAAAALFLRRYPDLDGLLRVVEHGVGGPRSAPRDAGEAPRTPEHPLRVAVIGGINRQKGQDVLLEILARNQSDAIEFHFFGAAEGSELQSLPAGQPARRRGSRITYHGRYAPGDVVGLLAGARIDVGLQLSTWPETFSYTLSEYALAGLPVVALPRGAVLERIERDGLGWTAEDASGLLAVLEELAREPARIGARARGMDQASAARPLAAMMEEYRRLYREQARAGAYGAGAAWNAFAGAPPDPPAPAPRVEAELAALREWQRSPRYLLVDRVFALLERLPFWPALVRLGERIRGEGRG